MKKAISCLLALLALLLPAVSRADGGENGTSGVWTVRSETGEVLCRLAGEAHVGDEYISGGNRRYEILSADAAAHTAVARDRGAQEMPDVSWLAEETAVVVSNTGEKDLLVAMYATHSDESYEPTDGTASDEKGEGGIYDVSEALKEALEARGFKVIAGDAADPMVLVQAHVASAAVLVIADRNPLDARKIFNAARELNNKLPVVAALRHVEDGATFPSDDPNLHILYTDLVAAISLSVTTLRCLMAEPEAEEEEAAAEDEAELKPEERLRRLFEAEYRRSVESVRGSAASVAAPQAVRVPQTAPATPAASAEALGKAGVAAAERRRASAAAAAEAAEGAGAQTSSDAASQASRSDSGFFGRARRFFSRRGR